MVASQFALAAAAGVIAAALTAAVAPAPAPAPAPAAHASAAHARPHAAVAVSGRAAAAAAGEWNLLGQPGPAQQSTNWAGYAVTGGGFTSVGSSWVQPSVNCAGGGIAAFWVGLDGWGSTSVEQDGTGVDCSTGSPAYFAWWETYPQNSMQRYPDPLAPGDTMTASVISLGGDFYELDLTDVTRGWTERNKTSSPGAANASAEVVAEAVAQDGSLTVLPDFGSVRFSGARINQASPLAAGVVPIDMTAANGGPLATPGSIDQQGDFSVQYQGSAQLFGRVPGQAGHSAERATRTSPP